MAGTFPNLSSGTVCWYPVSRTIRARTKELRFADDTRQAWMCQPYMNAWEMPFEDLTATDLDTLRTFWDLQKGAFDKSWTLPFDGTSYAACQFDGDDFAYTEGPGATNRYSLSLKVKQVKKQAAIGSATAVFPEISTGVVTQLPYGVTRSYRTLRAENDGGFSYTYAQRATPLHGWNLSFGAITAAEAGTLQSFFLAMGGRWKQFQFTDPNDASVHTKVCFAQDRLEVRHLSKNVRSTQIELVEYA